jgi:hypothetical protein
MHHTHRDILVVAVPPLESFPSSINTHVASSCSPCSSPPFKSLSNSPKPSASSQHCRRSRGRIRRRRPPQAPCSSSLDAPSAVDPPGERNREGELWTTSISVSPFSGHRRDWRNRDCSSPPSTTSTTPFASGYSCAPLGPPVPSRHHL